jgi:hypothetical protein
VSELRKEFDKLIESFGFDSIVYLNREDNEKSFRAEYETGSGTMIYVSVQMSSDEEDE